MNWLRSVWDDAINLDHVTALWIEDHTDHLIPGWDIVAHTTDGKEWPVYSAKTERSCKIRLNRMLREIEGKP